MTDEIMAKHQLVIDMFRHGSSREEIENVTGYQQQTISRILSDANLIVKKRFVRDCADTIRAMHSEGHTVAEIAKEIGFTVSNVREWMKQNGLYTQKVFRMTREEIEEYELKNLTFAKERPLAVPFSYKGTKYVDILQAIAGG